MKRYHISSEVSEGDFFEDEDGKWVKYSEYINVAGLLQESYEMIQDDDVHSWRCNRDKKEKGCTCGQGDLLKRIKAWLDSGEE